MVRRLCQIAFDDGLVRDRIVVREVRVGARSSPWRLLPVRETNVDRKALPQIRLGVMATLATCWTRPHPLAVEVMTFAPVSPRTAGGAKPRLPCRNRATITDRMPLVPFGSVVRVPLTPMRFDETAGPQAEDAAASVAGKRNRHDIRVS